jgi:hypothetical protein
MSQESQEVEKTWKRQCVLCAARREPVETWLEHGHCCDRCRSRLRNALLDIERLVLEAFAYVELRKGSGGGTHAFGSKPPINLDAIDPENASVLMNPDDKTSAEPILMILESWERGIRLDRGMPPYGVASEMRLKLFGKGSKDTQATLVGCVHFLYKHLDWITTEPTFGLEEFAGQIRRSAAALRKYDPKLEIGGTRIPCPTITDKGDCNNLLLVRGPDDVECDRCGRTWTVKRLLVVVGRDVDIWVDAEALSHFAGVQAQTIRLWARSGKVAKRGSLYRSRDVVALIANPGA